MNSHHIECSFLGEQMDRTNLLLERYDHRISTIQNQIEGLSKIVLDYCSFRMNPQSKSMKSIGLQVTLDKLDTEQPAANENGMPEKMEALQPIQPETKQLQNESTEVIKPILIGNGEVQKWTQSIQGLAKSRVSRTDEISMLADEDSRSPVNKISDMHDGQKMKKRSGLESKTGLKSSSGGDQKSSSREIDLTLPISETLSNKSSNEEANQSSNPKTLNDLLSLTAESKSLKPNVQAPSFPLTHNLPTTDQDAVRNDPNIPTAPMNQKIFRRSVIIRESIIHPYSEKPNKIDSLTATEMPPPPPLVQMSQTPSVIGGSGISSIENCPATSIPRSSTIQSQDSLPPEFVAPQTPSIVSKEISDRKRRLPCVIKTPIDQTTLANVQQYNKMLKESWYGKRPNISPNISENSPSNNHQEQQKLDNQLVANPKPLLAVPPSKEWISSDENINSIIEKLDNKESAKECNSFEGISTLNSKLENKEESPLISYPSITGTGVIRQLIQSPSNKPSTPNESSAAPNEPSVTPNEPSAALKPSVALKPSSDKPLENQPDLLGERSTNSYPPAVSTPSPPSTQLQRSISSAEIQQKIPELIAISDGDKSSHTNQSHPSATIITVSMADLNRLIRFRPVLRLKQVAKDILVTWDILDMNTQQSKSIKFYELYGKQEKPMDDTANKWMKLSTMKSLRLPMECRLSKFTVGYRYYFRIRTVLKDDENSKLVVGPFSESISLLFN